MNKNNFIKLVLFAGDVSLMYAALFLALAVRYRDFSALPGPQTGQFVFHFSIIFSVWLVLLFAFDFYDIFSIKRIIVFWKNMARFAFLALGFGVIYFYLNVAALIVPKTILLLITVFFVVLAFLWRRALIIFIGSKRFAKKIAVAGWCSEMDELARDYLPRLNYEIAAVFAPGSFSGFEKMKIFSDPRRFAAELEKEKVETVVFAAKTAPEIFSRGPLAGALLKMEVIGAEIFYEEVTGKISLGLVGEPWIWEKLFKSDRKNYNAVKNIFDAILSFCGCVLTAAIFPLIFLAVKLDSAGSVFYVQERKGKGGKVFKLYKFRTMASTPDQYLVLRANDPRQITRVGKIIKKLHIDEFPQFYNILKGDLSFAGPRPEWNKLADDYEKEIPFYNCRYLVKPGLTGWAQINYKASVTTGEAQEKFEYDLYYIKNRSFWLDISIIIKTLQLFFR